MKIILLFFYLAFLAACKTPPLLSLKDNKQKQIIAFQPFHNFDELILADLALDIRDFYNRPTIILESIEVPQSFYDTTTETISADSLIMFLSKLRNDTIAEVVGFTHHAIFTIKKNNSESYYDENLFGYANQPGNACVVSDFKFCSMYKSLCYRRLRKVVIHEIGHNLDLSHCKNEKCIMSEKNGNTVTLDNNGNDYCQKCKNTLYH